MFSKRTFLFAIIIVALSVFQTSAIGLQESLNQKLYSAQEIEDRMLAFVEWMLDDNQAQYIPCIAEDSPFRQTVFIGSDDTEYIRGHDLVVSELMKITPGLKALNSTVTSSDFSANVQGSVGWVDGPITLEITQNGEVIAMAFRMTAVWKRGPDGVWRVCQFHDSMALPEWD